METKLNEKKNNSYICEIIDKGYKLNKETFLFTSISKDGNPVGEQWAYKIDEQLFINTRTSKIYGDPGRSRNQLGYMVVQMCAPFSQSYPTASWYNNSAVELIAYTHRLGYAIGCKLKGKPICLDGVVNHINGCPIDNRINNLELTTPLANTMHGIMIESIRRNDNYKTWFSEQQNAVRTFKALKDDYAIKAEHVVEYYDWSMDAKDDFDLSLKTIKHGFRPLSDKTIKNFLVYIMNDKWTINN